jgi:membrane protease subunit HflC
MATRRPRSKIARTLWVLGLAALAWAASASLFTVDVTEYGALTRFGRVMRVVDQPGLGVKFPFERVVRLDKRLLYTKPAQAEYLTADEKNLVVHSLVTWRIAEPKRFLETLVTRDRAEVQLTDIVLAQIGSVLGRYAFSNLISSEGEQSRFHDVVTEIRDRVNAVVLATYGIEVVDIRVRQLVLPDQNKRYVFERMQAERGRFAMQYRSEGEREAKKIIAAAERERKEILAEAYRQAARIKGEADAEMIRIYATRFSQNPQFYKFLRTLEAYETILDDNTTIFLPADAEVFRMLQSESRREGND